MTKKNTPETAQERADQEARGESKLVVLTNDSGEVKRLTPERYKAEKEMLALEGWKELGDDSDVQ